MDINVKLTGPLFQGNPGKAVRDAIIVEGLQKFQQRIENPSQKAQRRLGFRRNKVRGNIVSLTLTEESRPLAAQWEPKPSQGKRNVKGTPRPKWQEHVKNYNPRRTGRSWTAKNIAIAKSMLPRQIRAITKRIVSELGG